MRALRPLLAIAVLLLGLCAAGASNCTEALADPSTAFAYWSASGKTGNDPGNYESCRVMFPVSTFCEFIAQLNSTNTAGPFGGAFTEVGISLCLPAACAQDIEEGYEFLLPYLAKYGVIEKLSSVQCGQWDTLPKLPTGARVMVGIIATLGIFVVLGSLLGFIERRLSLREPYVDDVEHENLHTPGGDDDPLLGGKKKHTPFRFDGQLFALLRCFSVFHNCPRLIAADGSHLSYLNGIRVLSMVWVISGHTLLWNVGLISNMTEIPKVVQEFGMQLVWQAPFSVDSFFFLSGLLVAYLSYAAMKKGAFSWPMYYVHRYVRLTPVYLFWIMVSWKLLPYIATGPYYASRVSAPLGDCSTGWWRDILYINNLFGFQNMCYPVAWYLGNDMQFYVVAPVLIYLFYRSKRVGSIALGACLVATVAATWGISYGYGISSASNDPHVQEMYQNMIYMKPWTRAGAYLVGTAAGLALAVLPRHQRYPAALRYPLYLTAAAVALTLIFSPLPNYRPEDKPWTRGGWAAYIGLSRTLWACCLAAFVLPFASGYGDFVRKFLGASFWTPLARLTFGAYLIHPAILSYSVAVKNDQFRYSFREWMQLSVFAIVLAYGLSFVSFLVLEKPLMNVEAWAIRLLRCGGHRGARDEGEGGDRSRSVNNERE